jgi:PAS domain S-box-containing protein
MTEAPPSATADRVGPREGVRVLVLPADLHQACLARRLVAEVAAELSFSPERVFDMQVAVSEATANAIEHSRSAGEVCLEAEVFSDRLEFRVSGVGEFHLPGSGGGREHRGLGLPLMAKLSDHLALYSGVEGGTLVALTFYRPGASPGVSPLPPTLVELLAEHSLFDQVLGQLPDSFFVFDTDWRCIYVNDRAAEARGLDRDEVVGRSLGELVPEMDLAAREAHEVALRDRVAVTVVTPYPDADHWWEIRLFPVPDGVAMLAREVTEAKLSERRIRRDNAVRRAIARIFGEAMSTRMEEELGEVCLRVVEEVTESKIGFVGEIGPDGLLHDLAISNPGWEACSVPAAGHGRLPGNFEVHGLYGWVLREGKAMFTNDPSSHPDGVGLPDGHPPLRAFLAAPLLQGDRVTGIIAVGNREGGYGPDQLESLESLANAVGEALLRKRAEESLRHTAARLELLSWTASELLAADEPHAVIDVLCSRMLEFLDCQVFFNFLVEPGGERLQLNATAGIPEEAARKVQYLDFGQAVCGWVAKTGERRIEEHVLRSTDPVTELIRSFGIRAYACHPLHSQGRVIGTLSLGTINRDRFTTDELDLMKAVADQVAIAVERSQTEEALRRTTAEVESARRRAEHRAAETRRLSDALSEIDAVLVRSERFDSLMQALVSMGSAALGCDSGAISLRREGRWLVSYVVGFDPQIIGTELDDRQERHALLALESGQVVSVDDIATDQRVDREHLRRYGIRSVLVAPLLGAEGAIGVIYFNHTSSAHAFSLEEIDFARKLAGTAALAAEKLPR